MITLHIDGKPAVLAEKTSFRLTRENPLFTNAGDFSLEIALPLASCPENQTIFGALHRREMGKSAWVGRRLPFRLVAHPLEVGGFLVVLGVTEHEVKVQLLGGRSAINAAMTTEEGKDIYIDELPLGRVYEEEFAERYPDKEQTMRATMEFIYSSTAYNQLRYGAIEQTNACCFPILSTVDKMVANCTALVGYKSRVGTLKVMDYWPLDHATTALPPNNNARIDPKNVLAPQPYLVFIIERIILALGLRIETEDNEIRTTWMKNILLANVRGTLEFRHLLPHWTVKEFFEQVQHFFGVVIEMKADRVRIVRKQNRYQDDSGRGVVELKEVLDAYTTELEQGERPDNPFTGNVGYKFPSINPLLQIPEEVYQKATVVPDVDYTIAENTPTYERQHSHLLYDAGYYRRAWVEVDNEGWKLTPVDAMGHLIRRPDRKLDVELKIVPVQMNAEVYKMENRAFYLQLFKHEGAVITGIEDEFYELPPIMAADDTRSVPDIEPYSLGTALRAEKNKSNTTITKRDVLEVAINPGNHFAKLWKLYDLDTSFPLPVGNPFVAYSSGNVQQWSPLCALMLTYQGIGSWNSLFKEVHVEGLKEMAGFEDLPAGLRSYEMPAENIQSTAFSSPVQAETTSKWVIDFADDGFYNPADVFRVRGRKFLCEKIEITLTEAGVAPIKRGYFYEVE